MSDEASRWGVMIDGPDQDKERWSAFLKPPFDPYVEEVKNEGGDYLVLRSTTFQGCSSPGDVHQAAKRVFKTLNVVMAKNADADPLKNGAVVEFVSGDRPKRHVFIEPEPLTMRVRSGLVTVTVTDAQGNVIEPPPARSKAQSWMRAASLEPNIASALDYLEGKPSFVELYKAFEALRRMPNGGISESEIKRFTQTANVAERHHQDMFQSHKRPMELWEARALITHWVSAAIEHVLANNPSCTTSALR